MRQDNHKQFAGKNDFPFAVGEVYGVRLWKIDGGGFLRALHIGNADPWMPGENVARCASPGGFLNHIDASAPFAPGRGVVIDDVPSADCSCGFYAYDDVGDWVPAEMAMAMSSIGVVHALVPGLIKGYGRTLIGTQGFRCEKAEIVKLLIKPDSEADKMIDVAYKEIPREWREAWGDGVNRPYSAPALTAIDRIRQALGAKFATNTITWTLPPVPNIWITPPNDDDD